MPMSWGPWGEARRRPVWMRPSRRSIRRTRRFAPTSRSFIRPWGNMDLAEANLRKAIALSPTPENQHRLASLLGRIGKVQGRRRPHEALSQRYERGRNAPEGPGPRGGRGMGTADIKGQRRCPRLSRRGPLVALGAVSFPAAAEDVKRDGTLNVLPRDAGHDEGRPSRRVRISRGQDARPRLPGRRTASALPTPIARCR